MRSYPSDWPRGGVQLYAVIGTASAWSVIATRHMAASKCCSLYLYGLWMASVCLEVKINYSLSYLCDAVLCSIADTEYRILNTEYASFDT
jgi:hypothetical protein